MVIIMAKNIALAEDVYKDLKRMKRLDESFSDVVRRLIRTRGTISDLAGTEILSTEEWIEMKSLKTKQASVDKKRGESLIASQDG
jgi:predicted CopG family antitoxin